MRLLPLTRNISFSWGQDVVELFPVVVLVLKSQSQYCRQQTGQQIQIGVRHSLLDFAGFFCLYLLFVAA